MSTVITISLNPIVSLIADFFISKLNLDQTQAMQQKPYEKANRGFNIDNNTKIILTEAKAMNEYFCDCKSRK